MRCRGAVHVPARGPVIFVSNHQSLYDPPIVGSVVWDRPFAAMARSTLFDFKPFAWLIRFLGAFPLRKETSDIVAMRMALRELERGGSLLLFPEGGRTLDGALRPFKAGFLIIARRSGAPVVPLALEGAYDIWPKSRLFPRLRGRILVEACPPIAADELKSVDPTEAVDRVQRQIETVRLRLRAELREETRGRFPAEGPGDKPYWER
jgi:1-acyl-sn-glycerol-3-phosphate acyltransferase